MTNVYTVHASEAPAEEMRRLGQEHLALMHGRMKAMRAGMMAIYDEFLKLTAANTARQAELLSLYPELISLAMEGEKR